jgi:membrane protein DedA with SNARE-associated domain
VSGRCVMFDFLRAYGYPLVFLAVLGENLGLPIPSFAVLLAAASLSAEMRFTLRGLILVSVIAALLGDAVWYLLGRLRGRPILRVLCSLSLNPDSCVNRTENLFERHGLKSLLVAKFIPGLNTVAPPLAGMLKISPPRFLLFDLSGIGLWAVAASGLGWIFRHQVMGLMDWLSAFGRLGLAVLAGLVAGWVFLKWTERRQFYKFLERSRISASELHERLQRGERIVVVDLRSDLTYRVDGVKIKGAIHIPPAEFETRYQDIPYGRTVVMYCT